MDSASFPDEERFFLAGFKNPEVRRSLFFGDEHVHEHVHEYGETDGNLDFTVIHGSEKHAKHIRATGY